MVVQMQIQPKSLFRNNIPDIETGEQHIEFKVNGLAANLELQIAESDSGRDQVSQAGDSS